MIPQDKIFHFVAGVLVGGVTVAITPVPFIALATATSAGFAKEILDMRGSGTVDSKDIFATALGGLVVALAHLAYLLIF